MALPQLQLAEPLVDAMVALLKANLNGNIDALNTSYGDGFVVPHQAQVLPYIPIPSTLEGGMPAIGVQEISGSFEDDLQFSLHATHEYAVAAILQHADHQTLVMQLRRIVQAIAYTIQQDRMQGTAAGSGGVMRVQGGAWSVQFLRTEPGPVLGDLDPLNSAAPPKTYLSWTALVFSSERGEI